jgi:CheY-like chemotaxis protein
VILGAGDKHIDLLLADILTSQLWQERAVELLQDPLRNKAYVNAEAIESLARENDFDVIVLSLNNVRDAVGSSDSAFVEGLRLMKRLKQSHRKPIIAMTGYWTQALGPREICSAGADYCLTLPFTVEEVSRCFECCAKRCMQQ